MITSYLHWMASKITIYLYLLFVPDQGVSTWMHHILGQIMYDGALNVLWSLAKFLQFLLISLKWDDTWRLNQILKKTYTLTKTKILKMYLFFLRKTGREKFSCNWHKLLFDWNYWRDSNIFLCVIFVKTTLKHSSLFYKIMCGI